MCQNGASCLNISSTGSYQCACAAGYVGPTCEEYDPCSPGGPGAECVLNGGTCTPASSPGRVELYTCACRPGFYGPDCSEFNPCSSAPCINSATCIRLSGVQYECRCAEGYDGQFCERRAPCENSPCRNGATCVETGDTFHCSCARGYYGDTCNQGSLDVIILLVLGDYSLLILTTPITPQRSST